MPMEKKTIDQGAPFTTWVVFTEALLLDTIKKKIATVPATKETGICNNSLPKYPISKMPRMTHDKRNSLGSRIASSGCFKSSMSYDLGMFFLKNKYKTTILEINANMFGTIICFAYSVNPIPKKSADTMLTRLLTTNGKEVVSAI